jgi:type II restriction enzyme
METTNIIKLVNQYTGDAESVYNTWFTYNETRMKAFRSIRRGVIDVINSMKNNSFGNDFKGSPLEFVLNCITEQKQVFEGAAHLFIGSQSLEFLIFTKMKKIKDCLANFWNPVYQLIVPIK